MKKICQMVGSALDIDPLEAPNPDINEINPDTEPEINELSTPEPNIDRDPTVEPGTNPMERDHSQFISYDGQRPLLLYFSPSRYC